MSDSKIYNNKNIYIINIFEKEYLIMHLHIKKENLFKK